MYTRILLLAKSHGKHLQVKHLVDDGIPKDAIPSILTDIIAKNDEANISLLMNLSPELIDLYYRNDDDLTPMQLAAKIKRWDHVTAMVNKANIDHHKARTGYALYQAVIENEALIVDTIIEKFNDINTYKDIEHGYNALHIAVRNNNIVIARSLLRAGVNVDGATIHGVTSLDLTMKPRDINLAMLALLCEFNVNIDDYCLRAARDGRWSLIHTILQNDKRPHTKLKSLLLMEALKQRNEEVLLTMLETGADLTLTVNDRSVLSVMISDKLYGYLYAILDKTNLVKTNDFSHCLPLLAAAQQWDLVERLIPHCKKLDVVVNGRTAMHHAIEYANDVNLQKLLSAGANCQSDQSQNDVEPPLCLAVRKRSTTATKILSDAGALLAPVVANAKNNNKWDDLEFAVPFARAACLRAMDSGVVLAAARSNATKLVEDLIKRGVSAEGAIRSASGNSYYDAMLVLVNALEGNNHQFLTSLITDVISHSAKPELLISMIEHGADLYANISSDQTAAHYASYNGKWSFVEAILSINGVDIEKAKLKYCLFYACKNEKWEVAKKLAVMGVCQDIYASNTNPKQFPCYSVVKNDQFDLLAIFLSNRSDVSFDQDKWSAAFEYAEENKKDKAKLMMLECGATHQGLILRKASANNADWNVVYDLIKQHYDVAPNRNETDANRKNLLGKLLHIAAEAKNAEVFQTLLLMEPDILVTYLNKDLLSSIADKSSWDCFRLLSDKLHLFNKQSLEAFMFAILKKPDTPIAIIDDVLKYVDMAICEPVTGNSLVHLAVTADHPEALAHLLKLNCPGENKNAQGLTPAALLFSLAKDNKLNHADKLSSILTKSNEWIRKLKLEQSDDHREHIQTDAVEKSQELCVSKLSKRYPDINVAECVMAYKKYVGHLPEATEAQIARKRDALYNTDDGSIQKLLALVWTGANDREALPEAEARLKDNENDLQKYIELRRQAVVEKFCQAKFETKASGSCVRGTRTKVIESLNHSHPDVVICYDVNFLRSAIKDHAISSFGTIARKLFIKLPASEQRKIALYMNGDVDEMPGFYHAVSQEIMEELKPTFSSLISNDEMALLLKPESLIYCSFYPFNELDGLIKKIKNLPAGNDDALTELTRLANAVYAPEGTALLTTELENLNLAYREYTSKVSAGLLASHSLLANADTQNNNNAIDEKGNRDVLGGSAVNLM